MKNKNKDIEWISVEERLPKEKDWYNVVYEETEQTKRMCGIELFENGNWVFNPFTNLFKIIYWLEMMPPEKLDSIHKEKEHEQPK